MMWILGFGSNCQLIIEKVDVIRSLKTEYKRRHGKREREMMMMTITIYYCPRRQEDRDQK